VSTDKKAFTLAEVIIVIGIVGIIAGVTIPTIIKKCRALDRVNKLKKIYVTLYQAFRSASQDTDIYTAGDNWNDPSALVEAIKPYVKYDKIYNNNVMCTITGKKGSAYVWLTGVGISIPVNLVASDIELANGACVGFAKQSPGIYADKLIVVDINGRYSKPNKVGEDIFFFQIISDGSLQPWGYKYSYNQVFKQGNFRCAEGGNGFLCASRIILFDDWKIKY
jgi:prepilin-type N-terminal cleavage/methylation domain-containing protein